MLTTAVLAGEWHDAVDALNACPQDERKRRLAELTYTDLVKLEQAVRLDGHGLEAPTIADVQEALTVVRALDKAQRRYADAVQEGDWTAAATALTTLPAPEVDKRVAALGYDL
jgi:hypothetical protein